MDRLIDRLQRFVRELRRRRVFRVAVVYGGTAFIVLQVCAITFPALRLPEWAMTLVVALLLAGAPIALIAAWAFEITPEGVVRVTEREAPDADRPAHGGKPFYGRCGHRRDARDDRGDSGISVRLRLGSRLSYKPTGTGGECHLT